MPSNEYMRSYMKERARKRMADARVALGNKCAMCGDLDGLEIDHIDPLEKSFTLSKGCSFSEARWQAELQKCQLLCKDCHINKSIVESGKTFVKNKDVHGTISSYRYCRCDKCKMAKSKSNKKYKKTKGC